MSARAHDTLSTHSPPDPHIEHDDRGTAPVPPARAPMTALAAMASLASFDSEPPNADYLTLAQHYGMTVLPQSVTVWESERGVLVRAPERGWMTPRELAHWLDTVPAPRRAELVDRQTSLERMYELTPGTWVHQSQLQSRLAGLSPEQQRAFLAHTALRGPDLDAALEAHRLQTHDATTHEAAELADGRADSAARTAHRMALQRAGVAFDTVDLDIAHDIIALEDETLLTAWLTGTAPLDDGAMPALLARVRARVRHQFDAMNAAFASSGERGNLRDIEIVADDRKLGTRAFADQGRLFFRNKLFNPAWFARQGLDIERLTLEQRLLKALEFSAFPGVSRHHWLTDVDFVANFARNAPANRDALDNARFRRRSDLAPLGDWLAGHAAEFGFVKPYSSTADRGVTRHDGFASGGHQLEHWHFTYEPIALALQHAYEQRFDDILPTVVEHVMAYIRTHFKPGDPGQRGRYDPAEINQETLLAALQRIGIRDYLTAVNHDAGH